MESTRRIIIDITSVGEPCSLGMKVDHVKRTVWADNKEVYSDRMSERQYFSLDESDPIRNLEMSLLGLKERQGRKNGRTYTCKLVCFFKKIWRKLFAKQI